jgi:hypothetical protein
MQKPPQWKIRGIFAENYRKRSAKHSRNYREISAIQVKNKRANQPYKIFLLVIST